MIDPLIIRIIALGFALLFFLAGMHKLNNKLEFQGILNAYKIVPSKMSPMLSNVIPLIELGLAMGWLVCGLLFIRLTYVPLISAMLLSGYGTAIAINLIRGRRHIDCGCGFSLAAGKTPGTEVQQLSSALLWRNAVLVIAALLAASTDTGRVLGMVDYFSMIVAVITLGLLYGAFNQLTINRNAIGAWRNNTVGTADA